VKLYDEDLPAPNPRRVRIYLAEKGIEVPRHRIALAAGEHKSAEFKKKNSLGQVPVLELDDGSTISESVSICRYFEALHPEPPLFGATPRDSAIVDMWIRRIELRVMAPIGQVWINAHPLTERYARAQGITRFPEFGEVNRQRAVDAMRWLDRELAGSRFIAGDDYTMADVVALSTLDFGRFIGIELPDDGPRLRDWHARVSARPSATA